MKRMHIHVGVENIEQSVVFYNALFGEQPVKTKPDYAKWMLEDPRINFAISTRSGMKGVDHLGIQADEAEELDAIRQQLEQSSIEALNTGEGVCCYARSEKSWVTDPAGIAWEAYHTMEDAQVFGSSADQNSSCCGPEVKSCC